MSRGGALAILLSVFAVVPALAGEVMPRAPLGFSTKKMLPPFLDGDLKKRSQMPDSLKDRSITTNQFPGGLDQQPRVPRDGIRLHNLGNQALALSYWNGKDNWTPISVASGGQVTVTCAPCGATIELSFHDGKENKVLATAPGHEYIISWSSAGVWEIRGASEASH